MPEAGGRTAGGAPSSERPGSAAGSGSAKGAAPAERSEAERAADAAAVIARAEAVVAEAAGSGGLYTRPYGKPHSYLRDRSHPGERRTKRRNMLVTVAASIATALVVILLVGTGMIGNPTDTGNTADRPRQAADDGPRVRAPAGGNTYHPDIPRREMEAVIADRSRALAGRNADAFVAPIDPAATNLLAEQRRLFANLTQIPFAESRYVAPADPGPTPSDLETAAAQATAAAPSRPTADIVVSFVHRVEGTDPQPVAENYRWTFARASAGAPLWLIAVSAAPYVSVTYPMPWDQAALVVEQRPHVVLFASVSHKSKASGWADKAETAAQRDLAAWRGPQLPVTRFLVYVTPDRRTFNEMSESRELANADGVCASLAPNTVVPLGDKTTRWTGCRVFLDGAGEAFDTRNDTGFMSLVEHELGHAMVAGFAAVRAQPPTWVAEGFAESLPWSDPRLSNGHVEAVREHLADGKFTGRLPTDADVYSPDPDTAAASYHYAMQAIRYMAKEFGADKAHTFVAEVYRDPSRLDAALTAATGLDRVTFEQKWSAYVKRNPGS
ncbi:hypothetical protein [Streptomyces sp. SID3343]|uniref:hypothetical protein n=1 Tax=Streptomyces sp. SID3343 TaxID=2690260 RepID=UPI001F460E1A|nr:hypothetical protein [Streptomyces sp. SID3343]